jgi:hypothetical protein
VGISAKIVEEKHKEKKTDKTWWMNKERFSRY